MQCEWWLSASAELAVFCVVFHSDNCALLLAAFQASNLFKIFLKPQISIQNATRGAAKKIRLKINENIKIDKTTV